ncbi:MAG: thioredoxin domain-containing protein [Gemmatimonadota bacterium]
MQASALDRVMLVAAVSLLGFAAYSQIVPTGETGKTSEARRDVTVPVSEWKRITTVTGDSLGDAGVGVTTLHTVVVFSDFECPMCKRFEEMSLSAAREQYGTDLTVVYRHWPLGYHRGARAAAIASECARIQAAFPSMAAELFEEQPTLSSRDEYWTIAARAGVRDSVAFVDCVASPGPQLALARDSALRTLLPREPTGTPTVLVDGVMLGRVPSPDQLLELLGRSSTPHR